MDDLAVAHHLADMADRITGAAFQSGEWLPHETKGDGSPVTEFDRRVEDGIAELLRDLRPEDGVLGEEIGQRRNARRCWVVDGIDGTINFTTGDVRWATQIALVDSGRAVLGVSSSPAQVRRWWATTQTPALTAPLTATGLGDPQRLRVSSGSDWRTATVTSIPPLDSLTEGQRRSLAQVVGDATYLAPTTHGAKMVAAGDVDACLQLQGQVWDYAALTVIVEAAGGSATTTDGSGSIEGGGPMLFTNGQLPTPAWP